MKALVISASGDSVESDLIAAKAAVLYAEETQLASARLYFTLRYVLETSRHRGRSLFGEFSDIAGKIGLTEDAHSRSSVPDDLELDPRSLAALKSSGKGCVSMHLR